jgi:murein L,D-transpeptidase YafK
MLNALLVCAIAVADTQPATVVLAGAPAASASAAPAGAASAVKALSPYASAMARPKTFDADSIVLDKSDRRLDLYERGVLKKTYVVALGKNPVGPKTRRGDGRTPEGLYYIEGRNPGSKYHLSLRVSYPGPADRANAARRGVSPGGDIMLHGLPREFASVGALHRQQDWTEGCVALTNEEIEEIWRNVSDGARILIRP